MTVLLLVPLLLPWIAAVALAPVDGRRPAAAWSALGVLVACLAATGVLAGFVFSQGPESTVIGGWESGIGIRFEADPLGLLFALSSLLVLVAALAHEALAGVGERRFPALVLFLAAGLNGLFLTGDVFNFYVFFELAMVAAYVLTSYRAEQQEAGPSLVLAVVNLLGTFIFLIGVAALYHATGTLEMAAVSERLREVEPSASIMIAVSLFVAFGVKLGLFPFHFWIPAVYSHAHPAVAAILAGALANIGAYGLLRFGGGLLGQVLELAAPVLIALGAASVLYASLQAIGCRSMREMLAYSSVGQAGYVLIAIGVGGPVGFAAAVIYAVVNSLNKGLLFLAAGLRGPLIAGSFAIGAFSLIGIPPAGGFLGKLALFESGADADSVAIFVVVALGGALSFVYALQMYQHRFWADGEDSEPDEDADPRREQARSVPGNRLLVALLAAVVLAIGIWPEPLVSGSERAAEALIVQEQGR